jgi:hypothetical protein
MKIRFKAINTFTENGIKNLYAIFKKSYDIDYQEFLEKHSSLDKYAVYKDAEENIIGFTGIRDCSFNIKKQRYRAVYFGQTFIEEQFRGKKLIQFTVIKLLISHYISFKRSKLIVWNDSLSYRPYLVMAKSLKYYYPNKDRKSDEIDLKIRDKLGEEYYPGSYCNKTGTVMKSRTVLKTKELHVSEKDLTDPDIKYYIDKNPNYIKGYGLITFCYASIKNLIYFIKLKYL